MIYELPTALEIDGVSLPIRSDYRAVLDICCAFSDPELTDHDRAMVLLTILYEDATEIRDLNEAIRKGLWFISCGDSTKHKPAPKLMDWEQDFKLIIAPINRVAGCEIRAVAYLHWWTFISFYYEIGDCAFANIVNIRNKKATGKRLEKWERDFYRDNQELIDLQHKYSDAEKALIESITQGR